ncbi:MAG: M23 family metallopeptidase [Thiomonas sp.]|uniref:M23 family metallopeptidase n=1 Tax=Thiomonas sp. TaxID=2047785 RepID=UPI002A36DDBE|nr:M23 family metallopeptidase [Thiomonas sp.]MDY0330604.1 M23 family metallopeptidase [Thiomonas sp.]
MVKPFRAQEAALWVSQRAAEAAQVLRAHPRRLAASVGGFLLLSSAGAYALVEAQPPMPPRTIVATVFDNDVQGQTEALAGTDLLYASSTSVQRRDTVQQLLKRLGVTDPATVAQLAQNAHMRALVTAGPGPDPVRAQLNAQGELVQLTAVLPLPAGADPLAAPVWRELMVRPGADGALQVSATERRLEPRTRLANVSVRGALTTALSQSGVPYSVGMQLVKAFAPQIDLRRSLRKGDQVALVYEMQTLDGRELRPGRLLAAQVRSRGVVRQAVWFAAHGDAHGGYYTPSGEGLEKTWAPSPLPGARVTSPFGMRLHPVRGRREMHEGVDLKAPIGTPVPSVAEGRVKFAGMQSGYGNVIKIAHPGGFETVYAHLSRIAVRPGQSVSKGQIIGKTGNTGTSTGPHLHFEFHAAGRLIDPLRMASYVPQGKPLPPGEKASFFAATAVMRTQLAQAAGSGDAVRLARVD